MTGAVLPLPDDPTEEQRKAADLAALRSKYGVPAPTEETLEEVMERYALIYADPRPVQQAIDAARSSAAITAKTPDPAAQHVGMSTPEQPSKLVVTLQAKAALLGYELVPMGDGSFVASRWGLVGALADAAAVEAFLKRAGAPG